MPSTIIISLTSVTTTPTVHISSPHILHRVSHVKVCTAIPEFLSSRSTSSIRSPRDRFRHTFAHRSTEQSVAHSAGSDPRITFSNLALVHTAGSPCYRCSIQIAMAQMSDVVPSSHSVAIQFSSVPASFTSALEDYSVGVLS